MEHTPTPWTFKQSYQSGAGSFVASDGKGIACISSAIRRPENAANAAFIVQACNAHDELVVALAEAVEFIEEQFGDDPGIADLIAGKGRAALAKAQP